MTVINNYTTWLALMQLVNVQQNGQIPPAVFNTWYNEVNKQVFKEMAEEFQLNQVMSDLLAPFIKIALINVAPQQGQNWGLLSRPTDYQYFVSASSFTQKQEEECFSLSNLPIIDGDGKSRKYIDPEFAQMAANYAGANVEEGTLRIIDSQRWANCLSHPSKGASFKNPKMTQYADGFKVAPKGIVSVILTYLSTPRDSVFAYTISSEDIAIYNPGGSTQLQWSDQVLPRFLAELQKKYAAYIGDDKMYQMGENDKKTL